MGRDAIDDDDDDVVVEHRRGPAVGTFLAGLAIGAGLALILAPQSGEQLRRKIGRSARRARHAAEDLADDVKHRATDLAEDMKHRAKDLATDVRQRVGTAIEEARNEAESRVDDARDMVVRRKRDLGRAVDAGRSAARDARDAFERRIAEARAEGSDS